MARRSAVEGAWSQGLFSGSPWQPTRALGRAALFVSACLMLGVVLGRLDLVALAFPFGIGTAWALRSRPAVEPEVVVELAEESTAEDESVAARVSVTNPNAVRLDLAVVRLTYSRWLDLRNGDRPYATDLRPGRSADVGLRGVALRWGHQTVGPATAYALACDGLLLSGRSTAEPVSVRVHPQRPAFRADDMMPLSSALAGVHRSRRPGEGGELAGVRQYGPGDRLRRVDWRTTLRSQQLHVAHTLSDRDAEVAILLDVLQEAGQSGGVRGQPSVVDTSVRAAAAIAEYYLRQGDRVGLLEYSGHPRHLRPASGRRQLQVVVEWLLSTRATSGAGDPPVFGIDAHLVANATLVVVLSPLLNPLSVDMIATLARAGRYVLVVDTLGDLSKRRVDQSQWTLVAQQLWRLDRDSLMTSLRDVGVPVAPWAGAGTLDQMLRDMSRMAAAPRLGVR